MNMKKCHHRQCQGGFTISEVVLAIGVVAFGLVAVLGVLPVGLAATKDNREETIIRYEALYWINALRAGAQQFDALDQVEWAEIRVEDPPGSPEKVYRAHRNRLGGDGWDGTGNLYGMLDRGDDKQGAWPTDVIGWLSIPNGTVKTKTVLVRPMNSTLFDRIYGRKILVANKGSYNINLLGEPRNSTIYHPLDGGDLTFAYLLEVSIEEDPVYGNALHKVKLTFKWPVLEDPTIENPTKTARDVAKKTISKMVFRTEIAGTLELAVTSYELENDNTMYPLPTSLPLDPLTWTVDDNRSIRGRHTVKGILDRLHRMQPGEKVTADELKDRIFAPRQPMPMGPVVEKGGVSHIDIGEINTALNFLKGKLIMEEEAGSAVPNWSIRRRPSGYGHFSMRPMTGATDDDGGYVPLWWPSGRLRGFQLPPEPWTPPPYFNQQYFFTPDNQ
jgi:type II secretory pathway pseudopilin PulG